RETADRNRVAGDKSNRPCARPGKPRIVQIFGKSREELAAEGCIFRSLVCVVVERIRKRGVVAANLPDSNEHSLRGFATADQPRSENLGTFGPERTFLAIRWIKRDAGRSVG